MLIFHKYPKFYNFLFKISEVMDIQICHMFFKENGPCVYFVILFFMFKFNFVTTPRVFIQFSSNLVCSIPRGLSKITSIHRLAPGISHYFSNLVSHVVTK